ncbi:MAG: major facilitator transporter [Verrucomicrobia bacterium]|nr:major facilitator transporter [Verrucomicrobiota bacterium]
MPASRLRQAIITLTVIAAAMIELIDTSIVNVALSDMSGNLGATLESVAWVVTSYAIANVIIIPMTSFLAARLGRRNYYIGSILLFTAASVACGSATNIWELVAYRFIQGIGGGALISTSQAILFETYTVAQRGFAAAMFGLGIFIGPTIGPTIGGWIIDHYSWPWIFYLNLPIGLAAAALSYVYVTEPAQARRADIVDWPGIGLLIVGLGSLQIVLERGETDDWFAAPYIVTLTITAAVSLVWFILHELRTPQPVVDLRILRSRTLAVAAWLTFVLGVALFASVFIVPVFAQQLLGFTAAQTGLLFLPGAVISILVLPLVGKLLTRGVPPSAMVIAGFGAVGIFCTLLAHSSLTVGAEDFFWPIILRSIGLCLLIVPLTQLAVSGLEPRDIPQGTALNNMMRQLGGSFGIALVNTYIAHRLAFHRVDLVSALAPGNPIVDARLQTFAAAARAHGGSTWDAARQALGLLEHTVVRQATLLSYLDAFSLVALLAFLCVPLVLFAGRPKPLSRAAASAAADAH